MIVASVKVTWNIFVVEFVFVFNRSGVFLALLKSSSVWDAFSCEHCSPPVVGVLVLLLLLALHFAAARGRQSCVDVLLRHGARVDATDFSGCVALMYAVSIGHVACAKTLLARGSNANQKDDKGRRSVEWTLPMCQTNGYSKTDKQDRKHDPWMSFKQPERL